ncbi:nuclear transport factor 2 family protein [Agromyces sp. SYSU T00194]|uniref:nuclear transport factor 2 family protein n=1 Tax=Agromyces chitinivorans TaxID=3158560 RepID=UPI00339AF265
MTPEQLADLEQIKVTKYRYYRFLDTKEFDGIPDLFIEHPTISFAGGSVQLDSRDELVSMLRTHLTDPNILTWHQVGQADVTFTSETTATAWFAQNDVAIDLTNDTTTVGAAYYRDEFVKVDGQWKYSASSYRRLYEETGPRAGAGLDVIASWTGAHAA